MSMRHRYAELLTAVRHHAGELFPDFSMGKNDLRRLSLRELRECLIEGPGDSEGRLHQIVQQRNACLDFYLSYDEVGSLPTHLEAA